MGFDPIGFGVQEAAGAAKSKLAWSRTKRLAQNSVRWRAEDMRRAGLNPLLAVMRPGGGTSAVAQQPQLPANMDLAKGANTAIQYKQLQANIGNINSQIGLNEALQTKAGEDAAHSAASAKLATTQQLLTALGIPAATNAAAIESQYGPQKQKLEWFLNQLTNFIPSLLFGVGVGRAGRRTKPNPPGHGRKPNKNPGPYVGPRQEPVQNWRSKSPHLSPSKGPNKSHRSKR